MIAAERRYIAAASVAEIDGIEPDLQSLPAASTRLTTNKRIARPSYTTPRDAILTGSVVARTGRVQIEVHKDLIVVTLRPTHSQLCLARTVLASNCGQASASLDEHSLSNLDSATIAVERGEPNRCRR